MKVEFDVKLQPADLFRFNIYQTYTGIHGILSILIAVIIFVIAGITGSQGEYAYLFLYLLIGLLVLFYIPVTLWTRAKHTIKTNEVLSNTLHFVLTEQAVCVTQGEESGELPWNQVYKMIATKNQILVYSTRVNAYIIPREQVQSCYTRIRELAEKQLPKYRVKMK